MDVGLHVVNFTWPGGAQAIPATLGAIAVAAENAGLTKLSVMDHYFQMEMIGDPTELDMLEGYTTLGYLAAKTSKMTLGLLITGVTYRHPGLLAKIITTLDVLSGGRAQLGVGAAWYEREHNGLGVPFPPLKERFELLEEALQVCLQMWSTDNGAYDGKHYHLRETLNVPQCVSKPHPPIMIGGSGEKKTLRLVAKYGNACNLFTREGVDGVRHKLDVLRGHCEAENRDYAQIEKTILYSVPIPTGDAVNAFVNDMSAYAKIGVDTVIVIPFGDQPADSVSALAPVVERLRSL
jgi:F420-dependent oxidoreductase-like protein